MSELPIWAIKTGVPSTHVIEAAVRVARMLDRTGSEISDLRRSYRQHASGAYFPEPDMIKGETLLVDCGLARKAGSRLLPTPRLGTLGLDDDREAANEITVHVVAQLEAMTGSEDLEEALEATALDADRREEILLALGARFDDSQARLVGEIGEEIVVQAARDQLLGAGHPELAAKVRRVSLGSDALGYDVTAPRTTGPRRLFEVKASTRRDSAEFFLSRNEWATGIRYGDDWFLVYCRVDDTEQRTGEIVGWCAADSLRENVPADRGSGEWRSIHLKVSASTLQSGLPY
jgi:hypothetical protein